MKKQPKGRVVPNPPARRKPRGRAVMDKPKKYRGPRRKRS